MTERHLHDDPPTGQQIAAATADIDAALATVADAVPVGQAKTLIGLAGSVTTVAGIAMGLQAYDAAVIHHARVSAADVHAVTRGPAGPVTRTAERAAIGVMHPGRVDVIGAGALVLDRIMSRFGFAEVLVSEHDILDGMANGRWPGTRAAEWSRGCTAEEETARVLPAPARVTGPTIRPGPDTPVARSAAGGGGAGG